MYIKKQESSEEYKSARADSNKIRIRNYQRAWYERNKEACREKARQYYYSRKDEPVRKPPSEETKAKNRTRAKKFRSENRELCLAREKQYYQAKRKKKFKEILARTAGNV